MYIMVKTYKNLELFGPDCNQVLSILESRKTNQANLCLAEDYNLRSTPKRMASAVKLVQYQRGLRKSSSLTNGMNPPDTKVDLESMALRPEVLFCPATMSMRPSWASADALSTAPRRRH
jgi:hypothetical protein